MNTLVWPRHWLKHPGLEHWIRGKTIPMGIPKDGNAILRLFYFIRKLSCEK
jgi:hypothetical protein